MADIAKPGERKMPTVEEIAAIGSAAAGDLNTELGIILSALAGMEATLAQGDPLRKLVVDMQHSAERCTWKIMGLAKASALCGIRPTATPMEHLFMKLNERVKI